MPRIGNGESRHNKIPDINDRVEVLCWCESQVIRVPLEKVRKGITGSCKLKCGPT